MGLLNWAQVYCALKLKAKGWAWENWDLDDTIEIENLCHRRSYPNTLFSAMSSSCFFI